MNLGLRNELLSVFRSVCGLKKNTSAELVVLVAFQIASQ